MENKPIYDVVVISIFTRKVSAVVGKSMFLSAGYHSAVQRLNTYVSRISNGFVVEIVLKDLYKNGDFVPKTAKIDPEKP